MHATAEVDFAAVMARIRDVIRSIEPHDSVARYAALGVECIQGRARLRCTRLAIGAADPYQFTHAAAHQAWYATVNALFGSGWRFAVDYRVIPWCTFTAPEVARVGLNETEARAAGTAHEVTTYSMAELDRAIADRQTHGFVKVLTVPGTDRILDATVVGVHAGEQIAEIVLAMKHPIGLNKIFGTIHVYPTYAEANNFAAGNWRRAHTAAWQLRLLMRYHAWRREH